MLPLWLCVYYIYILFDLLLLPLGCVLQIHYCIVGSSDLFADVLFCCLSLCTRLDVARCDQISYKSMTFNSLNNDGPNRHL